LWWYLRYKKLVDGLIAHLLYLMIHYLELLPTVSDLGSLLLNFLEPFLSDPLYPLPLQSHLPLQLSPAPHHLVQLGPHLRLLFSQLLQPLI
jgi:hypothetical protein